jgi:hypothetical protein
MIQVTELLQAGGLPHVSLPGKGQPVLGEDLIRSELMGCGPLPLFGRTQGSALTSPDVT